MHFSKYVEVTASRTGFQEFYYHFSTVFKFTWFKLFGYSFPFPPFRSFLLKMLFRPVRWKPPSSFSAPSWTFLKMLKFQKIGEGWGFVLNKESFSHRLMWLRPRQIINRIAFHKQNKRKTYCDLTTCLNRLFYIFSVHQLLTVTHFYPHG